MSILRRCRTVALSRIPRLPDRQERAHRREVRKYTELEQLRMDNPDAAFEVDLERALRAPKPKPTPQAPIGYGPSAWAQRDDV